LVRNFTPRTQRRFRSTQNAVSSRIGRLRVQVRQDGISREIAEEVMALYKMLTSLPSNGSDVRFLHQVLRRLIFSEDLMPASSGTRKSDLQVENGQLRTEIRSLNTCIGAKTGLISKLQKQVSEYQEQSRAFLDKEKEVNRLKSFIAEQEQEFNERQYLSQKQAQQLLEKYESTVKAKKIAREWRDKYRKLEDDLRAQTLLLNEEKSKYRDLQLKMTQMLDNNTQASSPKKEVPNMFEF